MKDVFFLALVALGFTSCVKSPEHKANVLIEEHVKSYLFKPDTYENVSTHIDSAFTPYCDPAFHEMLFKLKKIAKDTDKCDRKIEEEKREASQAKSFMTIYCDGYGAHSRNEYQKYKEEYEEHNRKMEEHIKKKDELIAKVTKLYKKIQVELSKKPQFIGFQAIHRYRADNNRGQTMLGNSYYVFDKDFSQILLVYDTDSEDFMLIDELINKFKEEQDDL